MENAGFTHQNMEKRSWVTLALVFASFLLLFAILGYAGGYGKVVDGLVDTTYRSTLLADMRADYKRDEGEWSFGYFVPLAVGALFWIRRRELLQTEVKPALVEGGLVIVGALFIYWAGYRGHQKYFGYISGQFLVAGMVLWFLGWAWFKKVFWLWLLLGMMWPWRFLIGRISSPLQAIMVKMTSGFMEVIGVDAVSNGSQLLTATPDPKTGDPISLDVDVACSGMRSLFALVMIGLVFAFLRVKDEWKRWVVMACVPVIAIIGNFVRMMMLYWGSTAFGTEFAIGEGHANISGYHIAAGLMVFVVALIILSFVTGLLEGGFKKLRRPKAVSRQVGEE
ncbi:MAG: exosortase/archaeosortase family protein [Verrucomicrobiota bacterium JB023]|nr:exosortase/archaeosortase family protein [Verrucomicrobiota bacterium JB023]